MSLNPATAVSERRPAGTPRGPAPDRTAGRRPRRTLPIRDVRLLLRRIHLAAGLAAGVLLVVAGLTGSALVFRDELDAWLYPELLRVEPGPERLGLDSLVAAVRAAYPADRPTHVRMPRAPRESVEFRLTGEDPLEVYVDPYRGTVLGARRSSETLPNVLFALHTSLLAGPTGEAVMGVAGLLLLVLVATGIVVWWPRTAAGLRRFYEGCIVRRSANLRRVNFDLHRAIGIWSALFLAVTAATGAALAFNVPFFAAANWITGSPPRPRPPALEHPAAAPRLPLDALVERGAAVVAGGTVTSVTLPSDARTALTVRTKVPAELHPNGRNFITVDPVTGAVLTVEEALRAPMGTRAYNVLYPFHIGRWGGLGSRILYALLGLSPAILAVSGVFMWWSRAGRRWLRRPPPAPAPAPPPPGPRPSRRTGAVA